jgi:hypothetical protein
VSLRELSKRELIESIDSSRVPRSRRCEQALIADPRDSFTATDAPAVLLRDNLEIKYKIAKEHGRLVLGGDDLLVALSDLGSELVTGVFMDMGNEHIALYLVSSTLAPIACVVLETPSNV